jgi:hypothetical protein
LYSCLKEKYKWYDMLNNETIGKKLTVKIIFSKVIVQKVCNLLVIANLFSFIFVARLES